MNSLPLPHPKSQSFTLFIHSFNKYVLSAYYMPGPDYRVISKAAMVPALVNCTVYVREGSTDFK